MAKNIYEFEAKLANGQTKKMSDYQGKTLLIVNVASKCGFTPQYKELEEVYREYKDRGLEILAFPCNQFGSQEPGSEAEIVQFCELNFGVTFPIFAKIEVNGKDTDPVFQYLKDTLPGILGSKGIKWNFTKFIVGPNGMPLQRYAPQDKPRQIIDDNKHLFS
jgi:glutathione peroxidase